MAEKLKVNGSINATEDIVIDGVSFNQLMTDIADGTSKVGDADKLDGADKSTDTTLASNSDLKIPTEKVLKTIRDALQASINLKMDIANAVSLFGDQTIAGIKTFSDKQILNKQLEFSSGWGTVQGIIYTRPAVTSGTTSIIWRSDSTTSPTVTGSEQIIKTFTVSSNFPSGSSINIYWETEDHSAGDHWRFLKKNGVTIASSTNNGGYTSITVNTSINIGDVITWVIDASSSSGYVDCRYARIRVNEAISLTSWEKSQFGLTG